MLAIDPHMDPHTAMIQCRNLVRAMQCLTAGCEGAQLTLTGYELHELLDAMENKVLVAIEALKKEEREAAAKLASPELWKKVGEDLVKDQPQTSEIPIEDEAQLEVSTELARTLAAAVCDAGFPCASISSVRPLSSGDGYQIACNRFTFGYCVSGKNGSWSVVPD